MKSVVHLDLNKLQLQNGVLHPLGSAPSTPLTGQFYFDTGLSAPRWYDGAAWTNKATDALLLGGSSLASVLGRVNHTGTQTSSTISDLATTVQAYRLDQFAVPTASLNLNSQRIINVTDPTGTQDAATMGWVQSQMTLAAAGIDAKPSVRAATTANITLSGTQTVDGVVLVANDRILVKNQTTASGNGAYVVAAGAWARSTDVDTNAEMTPGAFWYVEEGTVNTKTQWRLENTGAIVLGTTALTINQFGSATSYTAGNGISITGSVITAVANSGGGLSVVAGGIQIDTAVVVRKYSTLIGDGSTLVYTVTHSLNTQDVDVTVREVATNAHVLADIVANAVNTVTVGFAIAPASNAYRVVVMG